MERSERHYRAQIPRSRFDLTNPRVRKFFELYQLAQDMPRHLGQHSGGMVICQGQPDSIVPLGARNMPGRWLCSGIKKTAPIWDHQVDLLGLGMMAVIERHYQAGSEVYGETVDLGHCRRTTPRCSGAAKADTIGMFQVESRAQMSSLRASAGEVLRHCGAGGDHSAGPIVARWCIPI